MECILREREEEEKEGKEGGKERRGGVREGRDEKKAKVNKAIFP